MKKLLPLLFIGLYLGFSNPATAQSRPKKAKRAFSHTSESSRGRTEKARFRRESKGSGPIIDLGKSKPEKFKTAKASKPYKYPNPHN